MILRPYKPRQYKGKAGKQVRSVEELIVLATLRLSVLVPSSGWGSSPRPASVFMHQQATTVTRLIGKGMFVYEKPTKPAKAKKGGAK
jgi:hypothetical protein